MAKPREPTVSTLKMLFALSGNVCAFRDPEGGAGCEQRLADPHCGRTAAKAAHIYGENPGAPRFVPSMSDEERRSFANIILLCPTHHEVIDYLEPDKYTVEVLREMKRRHEETATRKDWADDDTLQRYSVQMLVFQFEAPWPQVVHPSNYRAEENAVWPARAEGRAFDETVRVTDSDTGRVTESESLDLAPPPEQTGRTGIAETRNEPLTRGVSDDAGGRDTADSRDSAVPRRSFTLNESQLDGPDVLS